MLGPDVQFELEWVSVYTFRCRRMEKFVHGRTIFLGDAAHQVSPFGARGGNAGVQDADNLGWKLAAVLRGEASEALIASYDAERIPANDENILHSTRSTDFITPKSDAARAYRDAVLMLVGALRLRAPAGQFRPAVPARRCSRPRRSTARIATIGRARRRSARPRPMRRSCLAGDAGLAAASSRRRWIHAALLRRSGLVRHRDRGDQSRRRGGCRGSRRLAGAAYLRGAGCVHPVSPGPACRRAVRALRCGAGERGARSGVGALTRAGARRG